MLESADIAATVAGVVRDGRYAYALDFSTTTDPAGYLRRAVAGAAHQRLRDAGWTRVGPRALLGTRAEA